MSYDAYIVHKNKGKIFSSSYIIEGLARERRR